MVMVQCKNNEPQLRETKSISLCEDFSPLITIKPNQFCTKKGHSHSIYGITVSALHWLIQLTKISFSFFFYTPSVYSKNNVTFSVSNDAFEWFLFFGLDSSSLAVKDIVQEMTRGSQDYRLAAWGLLLSQRQDFLINHLERVPFTPSQETTIELRDGILSSVSAQDMDTSGYQVSDLDYVDFY